MVRSGQLGGLWKAALYEGVKSNGASFVLPLTNALPGREERTESPRETIADGIWVIGCLAYAVFATPYASVTYALEWPGEAATKVESCAKEDATESAAVKTSKGDSVGVRLCLTAHKATDGRLLVPFSVLHSESNKPRTVTLKEVEGSPFAGKKEDNSWYRDLPVVAPEQVEGRPWNNDPIVRTEKQKASHLREMSEADLIAVHQKAKASANLPSPPQYIMNERYSSEVMNYGRELAARFSLSPDGMKDAEWAVWDARIKQWKEALQFEGGIAFLWAAAAGIGWVVSGFMGIPRGKDTRPA